MKIISVVGARPNFMKIAPFIHAINAHNANNIGSDSNLPRIEHILVHTGQHYDDSMSRSFFKALNIPAADINLGVGSGTHAEQVGNTMIVFEKVLQKGRPDWVVVVGDVNATCACSITAKKENIKVAHIEAGLRSRDMTMPEEINRLVTDRLSDLLLTPDIMSNENLINEGVPEEKVQLVGNIMIDTLEANKDKALQLDIRQIIADNLISEADQACRAGHKNVNISLLPIDNLALLTMHRPSNVDEEPVLKEIVQFLTEELVREMPLFWILHPRTKKQLQNFGLWDRVLQCDDLFLMNPLGYHELLCLNMAASIMLTDSGGLQEECCVLGTSCLTLRWNTERPVTLREHGGTSVLVGNDVAQIRKMFKESITQKKTPVRPELWDGKTAERIVQALINAG